MFDPAATDFLGTGSYLMGDFLPDNCLNDFFFDDVYSNLLDDENKELALTDCILDLPDSPFPHIAPSHQELEQDGKQAMPGVSSDSNFGKSECHFSLADNEDAPVRQVFADEVLELCNYTVDSDLQQNSSSNSSTFQELKHVRSVSSNMNHLNGIVPSHINLGGDNYRYTHLNTSVVEDVGATKGSKVQVSANGFQESTWSVPLQKATGPCDHCGIKDSPQWRRGPAHKPLLCNACGIRFRRTNKLEKAGLNNGSVHTHKIAGKGGRVSKKRVHHN